MGPRPAKAATLAPPDLACNDLKVHDGVTGDMP